MHVAIIGNGVTGVSAALRIRRLRPDWRITIVSGESRFHWSRPALMYIFMGHMTYAQTKPFPDRFWRDHEIDLHRGWVTGVDTRQKRLHLHGQPPLAWDRLLVATGSKSNRFGWPGQDLDGVQGLYGLPDLKSLYETTARTTSAVIVGGGLIGIELAEMLHSRNVHVRFLVRETSYWNNILNDEESGLINRLIHQHGIDLELETELAEIEGDRQGRAAAVVTTDGRRFECQLVGLTAGVSPNVDFLGGSGLETGRGVLVDGGLAASAADVWAAGDCAEIATGGEGRNLIQQVWYTGKMQGEIAAENIAANGYGGDGDGARTYDPGIWFNSAKFFDLEYHTYGLVNRRVPGETNLYWQHPSGLHSARVVSAEGSVIGLQSMGLRWRHEVAERFLRDRRSTEEVLADLEELAFDPEFHRRHDSEIVHHLREQLG